MNHPKQEEWVPYLFGEAGPDARRQLKAHLRGCAECRAQLELWQRSVGRLNGWKLPGLRERAPLLAPLLKWAVAACLVVGLGFGLGRLTAPRAEVGRIRAALEPELRRQLSQELAAAVRDQAAQAMAAALATARAQTEQLLANYAQDAATRQAKDTQAIFAALDRLENQRLADYLALKQDLDTVAINTDAGLKHTEQQLVRLADYTPAGH